MKVQALKRQKETDKVMSEAAVAFVRKLMDEGFSVTRKTNMGIEEHAKCLMLGVGLEELEHYLFPTSSRDSHKVNRGTDVVTRAIRDARKTFRIPHFASMA